MRNFHVGLCYNFTPRNILVFPSKICNHSSFVQNPTGWFIADHLSTCQKGKRFFGTYWLFYHHRTEYGGVIDRVMDGRGRYRQRVSISSLRRFQCPSSSGMVSNSSRNFLLPEKIFHFNWIVLRHSIPAEGDESETFVNQSVSNRFIYSFIYPLALR